MEYLLVSRLAHSLLTVYDLRIKIDYSLLITDY